MDKGLKKRTLFFIFVGTYFVLLISLALLALTNHGSWYVYYAKLLLYAGTGIAGLGFVILRGGTAINSTSGKTLNIPKTEVYAQRIKEDADLKPFEQVLWMIILAAILTAVTGYLLLYLG